MNGFKWTFAAILVATIAIFLLAVGRGLLPGLPYQPNMALAGTTVIGALLVVTLIVERAMAVVNALLFGERERQAELERIQAEQGAGDPREAEAKMKSVMDAKERVRLLLSFVAGLFVSAAGVRTLQSLLVVNSPPELLLVQVDVVLTAGLIAGGSNSLAFLAKVLRELAAPPAPEPDPAANPNSSRRTIVAPDGAPAPPKPIRNLGSRLT